MASARKMRETTIWRNDGAEEAESREERSCTAAAAIALAACTVRR